MRFGIPEPAGGTIDRVVPEEFQLGAEFRDFREFLGKLEQVLHVETRVTDAVLRCRCRQAGLFRNRAGAATREQAERRSPSGHAGEVPGETSFRLASLFALGILLPGGDPVGQTGRGDEQRFARGGRVEQTGQFRAKCRTVGGEGR